VSGTSDDGTRGGLDSAPVSGPPRNRSGHHPADPAAGGRPRACLHVPPCPPPQARDCLAARVIAGHPEQGWSLLCNGVVAFEDTGALLPGGSVVEPGRGTRQAGASGVTQAGYARTVAPMPPGRARGGGLRRSGRLAGAALFPLPSSTAPGPRQHAERLHGRWVPAQATPPGGGLQGRMAVDAW
jgi:hypothetical protein